jgi:hypothetical protein
VWSGAWRTEEWPPPKPGAAPEQAIHNISSCWLAPDGRLWWLDYEELQRFGWILHPTPRQGGPRGRTVLGEPSATVVDEEALVRIQSFLQSKTRSDERDAAGHEIAIRPMPSGSYTDLHDLIRKGLASLSARAVDEARRRTARSGNGPGGSASSRRQDISGPRDAFWLLALAAVAVVGAALWLIVSAPASVFGIVLWVAPVLILIAGGLVVLGMIGLLFTGEVGAALGGVIAIPVGLVVAWIVYSVGVLIWQAAADTKQNCPAVVVDLPGGPKLCQAEYSEGWAPPLFHF